MLEILRRVGRRSWRARARSMIEAERARPHPPFEIGDRLRRDLRERLARDLSSGDLEALAAPRPETIRAASTPHPVHSRRWVSKAVASLVASLVAYAPLALAGLGATGIVATGGYLAVHPGAVGEAVHRWRRGHATRAVRSAASPVVSPTSPDLSPTPADLSPTPADPSPLPTDLPPPPVEAIEPLPPAPAAAPPVVPPPLASTVRPPTRRSTPPASGGGHGAHADRTPSIQNGSHPPVGGSARILESRLLEDARAALRIGQNAAALKSLAEAERIPGGALAEERDALTIMALLRSGGVPEARRRLTAFEARYPQSFQLSRLRTEMGYHEDEAQ